MMYLCEHPPQALAKLRILISQSLYHVHVQLHNNEPARRLTRVRDFTFLPHLLQLGKPIKQVTMQDVIETLNLSCQQDRLRCQVADLLNDEHYDQSMSTQAPDPLTELIVSIAPKLHAFRIDNNQMQAVNLRSIATWIVGGWTQPGSAGDEKLRAVRASLP